MESVDSASQSHLSRTILHLREVVSKTLDPLAVQLDSSVSGTL